MSLRDSCLCMRTESTVSSSASTFLFAPPELAAEDFAKDSMIKSVTSLCAAMYGFFSHSDYRVGLLTAVQDKVDIAQNYVLKDVVTRWLSHAEPMHQLIQQYPALVVFFEEVQDEIPHARAHALRPGLPSRSAYPGASYDSAGKHGEEVLVKSAPPSNPVDIMCSVHA